MKFSKITFCVLILSFSLNCYSQIVFSKGYFVTDKGVKITCLIKNLDWLDSPKSIQFKLSDSTAVENLTVDSITEFSIDNFSRYVKATVKIDRSPAKLDLLNDRKQPIWSEETLLLKELVCGKAGLWVYTGAERDCFFYSIDNSLPEQLVFKEYLVDGSLAENAAFRQQLFALVQNDETQKVDLKKLKYDKESLINYFKRYNSKFDYCVSVDFKKPVREVFNAKIVGSINFNSFSIMNSTIDSKPFTFDDKLNWSCGAELEYFLSFNRNMWSLILSPAYEHVYYLKTKDLKFGELLVSTDTRCMDVKSITFPIGGRYTKYLENGSKLYADLSYSGLTLNIKSTFRRNYSVYNSNEGTNLIVGAGYGYKSWGIELKYHSNRNLLNAFGAWSTDYQKVSLSVTYKLFKIKGK